MRSSRKTSFPVLVFPHWHARLKTYLKLPKTAKTYFLQGLNKELMRNGEPTCGFGAHARTILLSSESAVSSFFLRTFCGQEVLMGTTSLLTSGASS